MAAAADWLDRHGKRPAARARPATWQRIGRLEKATTSPQCCGPALPKCEQGAVWPERCNAATEATDPGKTNAGMNHQNEVVLEAYQRGGKDHLLNRRWRALLHRARLRPTRLALHGRLAMVCFVAASLSGCSTGVVPPTVEVLQGQIISGGLLDQQLQLMLCVTNPNNREIALKRVTFAFSLSGDIVATGASEAPLDLPPQRSVRVPFSVETSMHDLGAPISSLFRHGTLDWMISGHLVLQDFTLVGIPYSVHGRITAATAAGQLFSLATASPTTSPCLFSQIGSPIPPGRAAVALPKTSDPPVNWS